jgi:hypothetical protein
MNNQTISLTEHFANQTSEVKNIFNEFKKPILDNVFFTNLGVLRIESDFYEFTNDRWVQRPSIFCMDIYEEPMLYPVIMLVNNIKSFIDFIPSKLITSVNNKSIIIAPNRRTINKILSMSRS